VREENMTIDGNRFGNGDMRNCNPYRRGIRFEYRTRNHLRKHGWYVVRQPRSMFPDLIAFRNGTILLVECRVHGYIGPAERRKIIKLARTQVRGKPVLAFRRDGQLLLRLLYQRSTKHETLLDQSCVGGN
jgi:Holliday junction resolvase